MTLCADAGWAGCTVSYLTNLPATKGVVPHLQARAELTVIPVVTAERRCPKPMSQREREITMPCEYTQKTKYEAKPCQEKVKKRKHDEKRKSRTVSTEYKARQDLDEGDADEAKVYNEYKRGELSIHGEDTYKKIKPDLKAINDFRNNTKDVNLHPTDQNRE